MINAKDFWLKVAGPNADGCWLWTADKYSTGYGRFFRRGAHRVAWEVTNGPIPNGMFVCHHCDVRACVNPAHLFLGNHGDNMRDKAAKGRCNTPTGDRNGSSKLSADHVRAIRSERAKGITGRLVALKYGVSEALVSYIVRRKLWVHL